MKKNNLQDYLDYYIKLKDPGFAVLVTGEWGVGKTYQVLNAIPSELQCYISLFGLNDTQEIYGSVFAKMYPGKHLSKKLLDLTKDITSEINGVTLGAGSLIGNIITPLIKQTVDKDKIIIFDDLERTSIGHQEVLGVINQYVEHHQCKVIVLAHDKKIHNDFITTKEKIIGHSIQVTPQVDNAAEYFFSSNYRLNNFENIKPIIISAFKRTGCNSLRVLRHTINDCNRLLCSLSSLHIKNTSAMQALFYFFCIVNIENRSGNITIRDIKKIPKDYLKFAASLLNEEKEISDDIAKKKKDFYRKYSQNEIMTKVIDTELLGNILSTGNYSKEDISKSLNESHFFIKKNDTSPWLKIINFDYLDSETVSSAIDEMFNKFKKHEIFEIGELIHSFCLSYLLAEQNEISECFDELLFEQKKYIDELLERNLLPPNSLYFNPFDNVYESSHSHGYWIKDSYQKHVNEIIEYIKINRETSKLNKYPIYKDEILSALDSDLQHFEELLLGKGENVGKFSNIAIFQYIEPKEFIIHWLLRPVESWNKVGMILNSRYRRASLDSILKHEQLWLQELCLELWIEANLHKGLDRTRIRRLIPYSALKRL